MEQKKKYYDARQKASQPQECCDIETCMNITIKHNYITGANDNT